MIIKEKSLEPRKPNKGIATKRVKNTIHRLKKEYINIGYQLAHASSERKPEELASNNHWDL